MRVEHLWSKRSSSTGTANFISSNAARFVAGRNLGHVAENIAGPVWRRLRRGWRGKVDVVENAGEDIVLTERV